ncbi:MarR family winged helix-turn-helix transcriptional regulator [Nakamurella sp. PAMC28650]|jgi:DNA-binding MarR family transcriptional regulator|uniref:MarR family winged helix-turn-helix transcriptional regulator n=1 Tax=Nakamurella sp. PAMC28650 TaxID=2762325 RepID=UPI00164E6EEE|nr:MarR family transcriptional regulator [Nakamurella sp. PAMC28650]QNK81725.1 MarR family transcriptional regulator [Nakamurella sp. PAMC28650]
MTGAPGGPLISTGYWLHHAALAWRREMDTRLRPLGLTHTQFDILASTSWLGRNTGAPTQQAVAEFAGIDRMMTSKIVRTLVDRGLIERLPDPGDARAYRLTLTPGGRETVTASTAVARAIDAEMFAGLPDPAGLRAGLTKVVGRT